MWVKVCIRHSVHREGDSEDNINPQCVQSENNMPQGARWTQRITSAIVCLWGSGHNHVSVQKRSRCLTPSTADYGAWVILGIVSILPPISSHTWRTQLTMGSGDLSSDLVRCWAVSTMSCPCPSPGSLITVCPGPLVSFLLRNFVVWVERREGSFQKPFLKKNITNIIWHKGISRYFYVFLFKHLRFEKFIQIIFCSWGNRHYK